MQKYFEFHLPFHEIPQLSSHNHRSSSMSYLKKHVSAVHYKKKPFKCEICGNSFALKATMIRHTSNVHEGNDMISKCEICNAEFKSRSGLFYHKTSIHDGKKIKCEFCSDNFSTKQNMNRHIDLVHKCKMQFKCEFCDYSSLQKSNVKRHAATKHDLT